MQQRRKTLVILLCGAAAWYGWTVFSRSERVTLHLSDVRHEDYYARIWVVDERPFLWIRAERPDRTWLAPLRESSSVTITRGARRARYAAEVWQGQDAREHVDALFRAKYGFADLVRAWLFHRETVPIRLTPL